MKKNMIKILMAGCEEERLLSAMSLLDDSVLNRIFELAAGDQNIYDEFSLPKPNKEGIINLLVAEDRNRTIEDIVNITNIELLGLCEKVRVHYTYKRYKWYKTPEDLEAKCNSQTSKYGDWCLKGEETGETTSDYCTINIDRWLKAAKE